MVQRFYFLLKIIESKQLLLVISYYQTLHYWKSGFKKIDEKKFHPIYIYIYIYTYAISFFGYRVSVQ